MADDGSKQSQNTWPLVKFSFRVNISGLEGNFQEVTGLSNETQVIEYRGGRSTVYATVKMPGIQKFSSVTLKKGIYDDKDGFEKLYQAMVKNNFTRQTITISLLDEKKEVAMSWTLTNAFPSKITVTDMKSDSNEAAVESMELAHEGLAIV